MEGITIVAAFVLAYSLVTRRLATTVVTGPMAFVAFGILVGPEGLDVVDLRFDNAIVKTLAKTTLILILFNDAAQLDWPTFWRNKGTSVRLLAIGLPMMILIGALIAALMFEEIEFWQAALIGVLLAPTDAALGQAVVTNKKVAPSYPSITKHRERAERRHRCAPRTSLPGWCGDRRPCSFEQLLVRCR